MNKVKVIAFYLPQFHTIPENDKWWGKGFTEWTNMKKAKPLCEGHYQPRIPLNNNYYNLLDPKVQEWQCKIAREYGVYGFCFYHYWFDGKLLLEKPVENYLKNKNCDRHFCICWANEDWTNQWVSAENKTLISQTYGNVIQWKKHFDYLLPFFKDKRYIQEKGKPLLVIYKPELISCLNDMLDYWNDLAAKAGLLGLNYVYQQATFEKVGGDNDNHFKYAIEYDPPRVRMEKAMISNKNWLKDIKNRVRIKLDIFTEKNFHMKIPSIKEIKTKITGKAKIVIEDYDNDWQLILSRVPTSKKYIPGAFVNWDNTPRKGERGSFYKGASPEKFKKYFSKQVERTRTVYHKDMLFIFAWNEWAEGGYLEPDERYGYAYLEAVRDALIENDAMPED